MRGSLLCRWNEGRQEDKVRLQLIIVCDRWNNWNSAGGRLCFAPCEPSLLVEFPAYNLSTLFRIFCYFKGIVNWLEEVYMNQWSMLWFVSLSQVFVTSLTWRSQLDKIAFLRERSICLSIWFYIHSMLRNLGARIGLRHWVDICPKWDDHNPCSWPSLSRASEDGWGWGRGWGRGWSRKCRKNVVTTVWWQLLSFRWQWWCLEIKVVDGYSCSWEGVMMPRLEYLHER